MGKIAEGSRDGCGSPIHLLLKGVIELFKLGGGKGDEEALEENNTFAKAGIKVVVRSFQGFPIVVFGKGATFVEFLRNMNVRKEEIGNQFNKDGEFVLKLRFMGEQQFTEEGVKTGGALTAGKLKIRRGQRG